MSANQEAKKLVIDEIKQNIILSQIAISSVDDDTVFALVVYYVSVNADRIEAETFDIQHNYVD